MQEHDPNTDQSTLTKAPSKMDILVPALFGAASLVIGFGLLFWQSYHFLRYGSWPSISLITFSSIFLSSSWISSPTDWQGIHWILEKIPASLAFLALGYGILVSF